MYHGLRVGSFRRPAGIKYPQAYADSYDLQAADPELKKKMYLFNCAQRAHANYLENSGSTSLALLIAGLGYPLTSSVLGGLWLLFRTMYMVGYTRTDKTNGSGRLIGSGFWICQAVLFGLAGWVGVKMVV